VSVRRAKAPYEGKYTRNAKKVLLGNENDVVWCVGRVITLAAEAGKRT
jgi:hypothetical protein